MQKVISRLSMPAVLAAVGGLILSVAGFVAAREWQTQRMERAFDLRIVTVAGALQRGLDVDLEQLYALRHFFEASRFVERGEFAGFTAGVLERHTELEGLAWAPEVSEEEREEYEAAARRDGIPGFQFTELGPGERPVTVTPNGVRYPAYYLAPMSWNQALLGLDLASLPHGREAITHSLRMGDPIATPWGPLTTGGMGFRIYLPVESTTGPPRFPDGAPGVVRSFVVGIFGLNKLVEASLQGMENGIYLTLLQPESEGEGEGLAFGFAPHVGQFVSVSSDEVEDRGIIRRAELALPGQTWELVFRPTSAFLSTQETLLPESVLGGGLLVSGLAAVYLMATFRRRMQIAEINEALVLEVGERKRAEMALRFLAEAGETLTSSLHYHVTLRTLARLTVPTLADFCVIDVAEDQSLLRLAIAHAVPEKEALLEETKDFPPEAGSPFMVALLSGRSELVPEVGDTFLQAVTHTPRYQEIIGELRPRSVMVVPLEARGRKLGVMTLVASDSERRFGASDLELAEELCRRAAVAIDNARLYEEAQAANRAKSDFLAVMSHELRTPLNAISGYADLLATGTTGPLNDKQQTQAERIGANADRQLLMIEEILAFARLTTDRDTVRREEVDLGLLAQEAAAVAMPLAEEKNLRFVLNLPDHPVQTATDADMVRHILLDLLYNAVKFTETGEVELSATAEDGAVVFRVRDTGKGIAPEHQEKIFDAFWQVEEALTREQGGVGLGLAVAQGLAGRLGGEITVASELGKGSTFTVRLPVPMPAPGEEGRLEPASLREPTSPDHVRLPSRVPDERSGRESADHSFPS